MLHRSLTSCFAPYGLRNDGASRGSAPSRFGSERGGALLMDGPNLVLDLAQVRNDARSGKLSVEQLLDIFDQLQQTIRRLEADKRRLNQRLAQYEPASASANTNTNPPKPNASYSVDAENQRRQGRRRRKKSPGRTPTE